MLNPRQYYALVTQTGDNGLINRDVQGTGLQSGKGVVEIAGIKVYKSMNIPFLGKYGTAFGGTTGKTAPGNLGSFVGVTPENASGATSGINNDYGTNTELGAKSCGLIFQKEPAGVVEAIGQQVQVTRGEV